MEAFSGVFDGQGHQIKNLYINSTQIGAGLFLISQKGVIKNLSLVEAEIKGTSQLAGLVCANNGIIENFFVQGRIEGRETIAGLVGLNGEDGEVKDSFFKGSIVANSHAESEYPFIGGLSCINMGIIERCYVQGDLKGDKYVGGLIALNEGKVRESFAEVSICASRISGGTGEIELDWLPFTGVFDGQGYRIFNLFVYRVNSEFVGFFTCLSEEGTIKNLHLVGVNIKRRQCRRFGRV